MWESSKCLQSHISTVSHSIHLLLKGILPNLDFSSSLLQPSVIIAAFSGISLLRIELQHVVILGKPLAA
jgi:hypothetical protein